MSDEAKAGAVMALTAYGHPLTAVSSFKYLGRVLLAPDNDWTAVIRNLHREQHKRVRMSR